MAEEQAAEEMEELGGSRRIPPSGSRGRRGLAARDPIRPTAPPCRACPWATWRRPPRRRRSPHRSTPPAPSPAAWRSVGDATPGAPTSASRSCRRRPRRARVSGRGTARLAEDSNDAIARGNMLAERNETALVLPNGASVTMLYWKSIDVEDEDYPNVAAAEDGAVIEMIRAPVLRLKTDVALRFGEDRHPDRQPRTGVRRRLRRLAAEGGGRLALRLQPRAGLVGHAVRPRLRRGRDRRRLRAHGRVVPSPRGDARADRRGPAAASSSTGGRTSGRRTSPSRPWRPRPRPRP